MNFLLLKTKELPRYLSSLDIILTPEILAKVLHILEQASLLRQMTDVLKLTS